MCPIAVYLFSQQQNDQIPPFHKEMTDDRHIKQYCDKVPPSQKRERDGEV